MDYLDEYNSMLSKPNEYSYDDIRRVLKDSADKHPSDKYTIYTLESLAKAFEECHIPAHIAREVMICYCKKITR